MSANRKYTLVSIVKNFQSKNSIWIFLLSFPGMFCNKVTAQVLIIVHISKLSFR